MEEQIGSTKKDRRERKRQAKDAERARQMRKKKTKEYITKSFVVLVVVFGIVGLWMLSKQSTTSSISSAEILQVKENDWKKGNVDADVILVEYLDFECEACGAYYPLVERLLEEYGDEVLFVSRYFPLTGHKNGMTSALAIEAAGRQGKYWEMHNIVFEEQESWSEKRSSDSTIFEQYAEKLGLDMEQFKQDAHSQEVKDRVIGDRDSGNQLGVRGTPTFFLNGEKIQNPRGYEAFKTLLDNAIGQQNKI